MTTTHLHSATPWKIDHKSSGHPWLCYIRRDVPEGHITGVIAGPLLLEEGRFIVLAVNNHERLLEAVRMTLTRLRNAYGPVLEGDDDDAERIERSDFNPQHGIQLILEAALAAVERGTA